MVAPATFWAILMILSTTLSLLLAEATITARAHHIALISFIAIYGLLFLLTGFSLLMYHTAIHAWSIFHDRIGELPRGVLLTAWIVFMVLIRSVGETSVQAVGFWFLVSLAVFSATRAIRPSTYDSGFFGFCCSTFAGQSWISFDGSHSPYTWMALVVASAFLVVDYVLIMRHIREIDSVRAEARDHITSYITGQLDLASATVRDGQHFSTTPSLESQPVEQTPPYSHLTPSLESQLVEQAPPDSHVASVDSSAATQGGDSETHMSSADTRGGPSVRPGLYFMTRLESSHKEFCSLHRYFS